MFFYRESELNLLNEDFDKANSSLSFIFARRQVGKTTLLNEYTKNKNCLYLSAFETINFLLLKEFKKTIDDFTNNKNEEMIKSFEDLFIYLGKIKIENKIVIVLEDIQELIKIDKKFLINFNNYWNKYLKNMNIQFIITSSFLPNDFENLAIAKKVDNKIKLKPLSFNIIQKLLPDIKLDDLMLVYSLFGTNPTYLKFYDTKENFFINIKNNFQKLDSILINEGMNIIKKDLSDVLTYCSVLHAISIGKKKIGDIASFLNLKSSYLTRYMQKLLDLMLVNKIVPINENPSKSKFGRYEIDDNFLKFWFCYIYPNINFLNTNKFDKILNDIEKDYDRKLVEVAYKKHVSEEIQNDHMSFLDYRPKKIGSWWNNKDIEIDLIAYDSKTITFIDCKWTKSNSLEDDYKALESKAKKFETQLEKKYLIFNKEKTSKIAL